MARPKREDISVEEAAQRMLGEVDRIESDKAYAKLSASDRALIIQLAAAGNKSQEQIATFIGCHRTTVSRVLSECKDMTAAAKAFLQGQLLKMAENVAENGDPELHAKMLERFGAVPAEERGRDNGIVIVLGSVEKPIVPPRLTVLDVQATPAALPSAEDAEMEPLDAA